MLAHVSAESKDALLGADILAHAEALGLYARGVVEGLLSGEHRSPFRGAAVEFSQHREYVQGDDLRRLDWKVLARLDRLYIKQYEQETNFICHLLVDASGSMGYASANNPRKLDAAKRLAACIAYLVLSQGDAAILSVFSSDSGCKQATEQCGSLSAVKGFLIALASMSAAKGDRGAVGKAIAQASRQQRRRGIVAVFSDFLEEDEQLLDGLSHARFAGQEVIAFHIIDPAEIEFPFTGEIEFADLEGGPPVTARAGDLAQAYHMEVQAFITRTREAVEQRGGHHVLVRTDIPLATTLAGYLARRRAGPRAAV